MFSGKSEDLVRRLRRASRVSARSSSSRRSTTATTSAHVVSHAGRRCAPSTAARAPKSRGSHRGTTRSASTRCSSSTRRSSKRSTAVAAAYASSPAGLAQDFRGRPFGAMPALLCVAEFVDKLEAVCHRCGGPATMTQRLVDGSPPRSAARRSRWARSTPTRRAAEPASSRAGVSRVPAVAATGRLDSSSGECSACVRGVLAVLLRRPTNAQITAVAVRRRDERDRKAIAPLCPRRREWGGRTLG